MPVSWKWREEAYEDALKELNTQMKALKLSLNKAEKMRFAAERCLRDYKRKQTFAMTFRSFDRIEELCHSKSVLLGVRKNSPNLYTAVAEIFNR